MRAVSVGTYGGPDVLDLVTLPEPEPGPGEVSITVQFAGVNYTDVRNRQGDGLGVVPFVPGVEVSGTVRAVGPGVDSLAVGQPVASFTRGHGYAEVVTALERFTVALPDALVGRPESAAMLVTVPVALVLLERAARARTEDVLLVHSAAGGVGTVLGQLARARGIGQILGTVGSEGKTEFAGRHGYSHVFLYAEMEDVVAAHAPGGVDVVLDPIGGEVRARSFELLAPFGRLVTYSNISRQPEVVPGADWMRARCVSYTGLSNGQLSNRAPEVVRTAMEHAVSLVADGEVSIPVTEVFPLADAVGAHRLFEARAAFGKIVLAV